MGPDSGVFQQSAMHTGRRRFPLFLAGIVWLALSASLSAQGSWRPILVLVSNHSQSHLEQEQIAGLRSVLPPDAEIILEYLDAKRLNRRRHYLQFYESLMYGKYKTRRLAAIVALNDDAIRFMNYYRQSLFRHPPLVVCGSRLDLMDEMHDLSDWTGVFSRPDLEKTILGALELHPEARRVHLVADRTLLGREARKQLTRAADAGRIPVPVEISRKDMAWSFKHLFEQVHGYSPDSIAFYAEYSQDGQGEVYLPQHLVPRLSKESKAPIYTMRSEAVGVGAVGGHVVNGRLMGEKAGEMIRQVLAGKSPGSIPPVVLEGEWLFDHAQLKRWGIPERNLPEGSRIIGRPVSFFARHKWILIGGGIVVAAEAAIIVLLLIHRAGRKRARRALQASETRYRSLFEISKYMSMIMDRNGAILHANPSTCRLLGYSLKELVGKQQTELVRPSERDRIESQFRLAAGGAQTVLESCLHTREGHEIPVELLFQPFDSEGGGAVVCFAQNLSERIKQQRIAQEISERERQAMGHDIHDGLGQYLTALRFQCHRLEQGRADQKPVSADDLEKLSSIVAELTSEVRNLARSLVPLHLVSRTLHQAMQENINTYSRHFHLKTSLEFTLDESKLSPDAAAHLYRIVQEGIRNAVRHARATSVQVVLKAISDTQAELSIVNDGELFELLPGRRAGMGLGIMEQRARMIGGKLDIRPTDDKRTRLTCTFPLKEAPISTHT